MYEALQHIHSVLRWVVLILIIINIFNAIGGLTGDKLFTPKEKKLSLVALVFTHLQAIFGIALFFTSPKVQFSGETMSNTILRFFTVEHTLMMLIAVILITIGNRMAKSGRVKAVFWYYFIALILIIAGIPWPFREELGAGWF